MNYIANLESAKKKIISLYPGFRNSNFVGDDKGWANYAVKVDNKYIFRFCRNYDSYKTLKIEDELLSRLRKKLPRNIQVPDYIYKNLDNDGPFVGYEMIQGNFLSKELYNSFVSDERKKINNNIKIFINTLHNIDYCGIDIPVLNPISFYKDFYKTIQEKCYLYFDDGLKEKTDKLFNDFFNNKLFVEYEPKCVHGDLSTDHILITKNGIGIIDFGDLRIFDPCYDMSFAYAIDKNLFDDISNEKNEEYRITNFYIKISPYHMVLYGIEINNDDFIINGMEKLREW